MRHAKEPFVLWFIAIILRFVRASLLIFPMWRCLRSSSLSLSPPHKSDELFLVHHRRQSRHCETRRETIAFLRFFVKSIRVNYGLLFAVDGWTSPITIVADETFQRNSNLIKTDARHLLAHSNRCPSDIILTHYYWRGMALRESEGDHFIRTTHVNGKFFIHFYVGRICDTQTYATPIVTFNFFWFLLLRNRVRATCLPCLVDYRLQWFGSIQHVAGDGAAMAIAQKIKTQITTSNVTHMSDTNGAFYLFY